MINHILVIGKNGQLGRSLQKVVKKFTYSDWDFFFITRNMLDLSNLDSINDFFQDQHFSAIINCAAYTSVDKAENNFKLADQINHLAVARLAEIAKNQSIPLIHISTDYVFHGKGLKPYEETDKTNPQNIYGLTKLKGEQVMMESGCTGAIIRTSWLHSEFGNNFVKTMLALGIKCDSLKVVIDQVSSPTYATNLAKLLIVLLNKNQITKILNSQFNIYHFSDEGNCSWYDFAKAIFELSDISCKVKPVETKDYPSSVKRPKYSVMNKTKIKNHLPDLEVQHWRESLIDCLAEIKNKDSYLS
jgi:dTDP-4-dehydrorhamnose reductase